LPTWYRCQKILNRSFCDIVAENAVQYVEKYTLEKPRFFDYHQMFDQVPVDFVFICLPLGAQDEVGQRPIMG
jgi:predicted dehydrogenase